MRHLKPIIFGVVCAASLTFSGPAWAAPTPFKVDSKGSTIKWTGEKVTGAHYGTLSLRSGEALVQDGKLVGGKFELAMDTIKVVDIEDPKYNKKLADHLNSDDFFSVSKFPTASFVVTKAEPITAGDGGANYSITGDLTIKGITLPITFPAQVTIDGTTATAKASTTVDRTKYNVKYNSGQFFQNLGDKLIYDEFKVELDLASTRG